MDAWIITIVVAIVGLFAWRYWHRALRAGRRAVALSEYTKQFSVMDARRMHDLALSGLVFAPRDGRDANQDLEIVVALRDRVDELEGRPHGLSNKIRLRTALSRAVAHLFKDTSTTAAFSVRKEFGLGETIPDSENERLGLHITMMGRVYEYLDKAPRLPELDKYASRG